MHQEEEKAPCDGRWVREVTLLSEHGDHRDTAAGDCHAEQQGHHLGDSDQSAERGDRLTSPLPHPPACHSTAPKQDATNMPESKFLIQEVGMA